MGAQLIGFERRIVERDTGGGTVVAPAEAQHRHLHRFGNADEHGAAAGAYGEVGAEQMGTFDREVRLEIRDHRDAGEKAEHLGVAPQRRDVEAFDFDTPIDRTFVRRQHKFAGDMRGAA